MAVSLPRRSTEPGRPRHRRGAPGALVDSTQVIGDLGKLQRQLADLGGPKPTHVVSVTVPVGAKEGESIEAKASDGSTVRITVPAGTAPGATLHVRVPVALPPPVAQGTPVVTTTAEPVEPAK